MNMDRNIMKNILRIILLAVLWSLFSTQLSADTKEHNSRTIGTVSKEVLQGKIKEVEAGSLNDETKKILIELYNLALRNNQKAKSYTADAESFSQARETSSIEVGNLRNALKKIEKVSSEKILNALEKMTSSELAQQQEQEKADLSAVEAKLSDINNQLVTQSARPNIARERLVKLKGRLDAISIKPKTVLVKGESASITQAEEWVQETQTFAHSSEIKMLDQELLSYGERMQVLKAKKDLAESKVKYVMIRVQLINDLLNKRRLEEVKLLQKQVESTKEESKGKHLLVRKLAEKNVVLGKELKIITLNLEGASAQENQNRVSAKRIGDELSNINHKIRIAGINQEIGEVLHKKKDILPKISIIQSEINQLKQRISDSGLRQIQYEEEYKYIRDIETYLTDIMKGLPQSETDTIRTELKDLVLSRQTLLSQIIDIESSYSSKLGELDISLRKLIDVVKAYDDFLDKHLLWVRSTKPISLTLFKSLPGELELLLSPSDWMYVGNILIEQFTSTLLVTVLFLALVILMFMRKYFLDSVVAINEKIRSTRTDHFGYTIQAFFLTALASLPVPLLFMIAGWQLSLTTVPTEFSNTVSFTLKYIWTDFFYLLFFIDLAIPEGVLRKHFRWSAKVTSKLHHELKILLILLLPSLFITIFSYNLDSVGVTSGFTMLGLLFIMGAIGLFLLRTFTPSGGVLLNYFKENDTHLMVRLRFVWQALIVVLIISTVVLILLGYLHTASTLMHNLVNMLWLMYPLVLIHGLLARWLLLVKRRLEVQAIMTSREEARKTKETLKKTGESKSVQSEYVLEIDEPEADLVDLGIKSRKLLHTILFSGGVIGLWFIWSPMLPAFGILNEISIWSTIEMIDGVKTIVPVTLGDLILAVIVIIVTIISSRGLPALLEFVLLQNKDITIGGRYTATTLFRYVIVAIGTLLFFSILGASWTQIQWLAAALSVGIGFGLQEIVANFISGLIILFERPIRVGDTVTIGANTGIVTRIQIRATTITNWERQELLVPNKAFITQELLNWTLSDQVIRISIVVGVAYGSDVTKAMKILKEAALEHSSVLKSPEANVIFTSFDDNSLKLTLRAYLGSVENRIGVITDLHEAINRKFNDSDISIAFPQRDVHLDINQPIDMRLHREKDNEK